MFYHLVDRHTVGRSFLFMLGGSMILYAIWVLVHASSSYELGIRSILTPNVLGDPSQPKGDDVGTMPKSGDLIHRVGDKSIEKWSDLLQAPQEIHQKMADPAFARHWLRREPQVLVEIEYSKPQSADPDKRYTAWCPM